MFLCWILFVSLFLQCQGFPVRMVARTSLPTIGGHYSHKRCPIRESESAVTSWLLTCRAGANDFETDNDEANVSDGAEDDDMQYLEYDDDDHELDDEYDEIHDNEEEYHDGNWDDDQVIRPDPPSTKSSRSKRSSRRRPQRASHSTTTTPPSYARRGVGGRRPAHWSRRLAAKSLKVTSALAWETFKTTGNLAYQLFKPRHVQAQELKGLWRLDQQVSLGNHREVASVATIQLNPKSRTLTLILPDNKAVQHTSPNKQGIVVEEQYTFTKTRLGSWETEFVAPAFMIGTKPRLYGYRGYWQRKIADPSVIKLVGKIYRVHKQRRFGISRGGPDYQFGQAVGTFVARRRIQLNDDDEYDNEDDDFDQEDDNDDDEMYHYDASDDNNDQHDEDHNDDAPVESGSQHEDGVEPPMKD